MIYVHITCKKAYSTMYACTYAHTITYLYAHTNLIIVNALSNPCVQHQSIPLYSADTKMLAGIRSGELMQSNTHLNITRADTQTVKSW